MPRTTKTRLGKQTKTIWPAAQPLPSAPPAELEYIKTTVALTKAQMTWLVRLEADIRANTGASVARTAIIRAALDAVRESGRDLTRLKSEAEVKAGLLAPLQE